MPGMINKFRRAARKPQISDRIVPGKAEAILVSFCNMATSRAAPLAIVSLADGEYRWLNLHGEPDDSGPPNQGGRALCWHEELVCAAYRTSARNAEMTLFDPGDGYRVRGRFPVPAGVHSSLSHEGDIYMTTSMQDSVYRASVDRRGAWKVERIWTMPGSSGTEDESHVNGIAVVGGKLCVSGLGRKTGSGKQTGFVYDIEAERYVANDIHGPHSLLWDGERTWTCASVANKVLSLEGREYEFPTTYLRGLVMDGESIFAASSKRRTRSLSTGKKTGVSQERRGECSLWRMDTAADRPAERLVDFSEHRHEIYDLLPVPALSK